MSTHGYGIEGRKYLVRFYPDMFERQERCGNTRKVIGIIENFNPSGQTAIRDENEDLWLIDSRLIAVMNPVK